MGWLARTPKCGRCNRALNSRGACPVCSAIVRAHGSGRNAVTVKSYACTDGKVRVHRNGICAGPC